MRIIRTISILSMFYCVPAYASYFEVCLISGEVASSPNLKGKDVSFEIHILSSTATNCKAAESYRPEVCDSYTNQKYEINLPRSWKNRVELGAKLDLIQQKYDDAKGNRYMSLKSPKDCE